MLAWLEPLAAAAAQLDEAQPFAPEMVRERAKALARTEFVPPPSKLPKELKGLNYDQYRDIRFRPDQGIWRGEGTSFELQLFHLGFFFDVPVQIHLVEGNSSRRLRYSANYFHFGPSVIAPPPTITDLDFSGFRIHFPLNRADYYDEFAVFQGASYFRAIGRGQGYGLSARGLSLDTAEPSGEEFPIFRTYWIERPSAGSGALVLHALLDSRSAAGAYRFVIRPGEQTEMEVQLALYPRVDLANPGIAPLTSMFFFGSADRVGVDDFRPAVHDSDGLAIWNGRGERLWRPLTNPSKLQISQFLDTGPRGFGLLQRKRRFEQFEDLEARYEKRPSLWVEPVGDWGPGAVHLIEIPSDEEIHDNIVAFWRPAKRLVAGAEFTFSYRLFWCWTPMPESGIAAVASTRVGIGRIPKTRLYVIDFEGERLKQRAPDKLAEADVRASAGNILHPVVQAIRGGTGQRVSFMLDPGDAKVVEMRCHLAVDGERVTEVWMSRWTS
jgi:glucans biosynthesis protein